MVTMTGWLPDGTLLGIATLIWKMPSTLPGTGPAYSMPAALKPPIVTETDPAISS